MKIAIIGYGKMGRAIEQIALQRGHEIVAIIDVDADDAFESAAFRSADVAIEFTTPSTAYDNYQKCFAANIPVVTGTTGWTERLDDIRCQCAEEGKTFFYASNFSVGVHLFFTLNRYMARLMNNFPDYDVSIKEIHHVHKLDAPSGTAITLAGEIAANMERKHGWELQSPDIQPSANAGLKPSDKDETPVAITSLREGEVPGFHEVRYASAVDEITISHNAKSRQGFALGAVLAAEFTRGKKGFLSMHDMLPIIY